MRYRTLGRSGLRVSELMLGAMTFGHTGSGGTTEEAARKVVDLDAEAGGDLIDTANRYGNGGQRANRR